MKRRSRLPEHPRQPIYLIVYKAAGNPVSAPSVLFPIFGFSAVTALLGCRDLLPGRLRFGVGTVRSYSIAESFRYSRSAKCKRACFCPRLIHFGCGAVTALLECRDLLPDRLRFGFGTVRSFSIAGMFQILPPGKMQVNLLLPSLIRILAAPKILPLGNVQINLTLPSLIRIFAEV